MKRLAQTGKRKKGAFLAALATMMLVAVLSPARALAADSKDAMAYSEGDGGSRTYYATVDDAIKAAQGGATVVMNRDWELTSRLTISEDKTVTIDMNGHKIANDGSSGVIKVSEGGKLVLQSTQKVEFSYKGYSSEDGSQQDFKVTSGGLVTGGNASSDKGGGIYLGKYASLILDNVAVAGNRAEYGGGIEFLSGNDRFLDLYNGATVQHNRATYGAGISIGANNCNVNLTGEATISDNYAEKEGGAIFVGGKDGARVYINGNSSICNNSSIRGSAFFADVNSSYFNVKSDDQTGTIKNNVVRDNGKGTGRGGAIYFDENNWGSEAGSIDGLTISGNSCPDAGGGIYMIANNIRISNCTITDNVAGGEGGGVYSAGRNCVLENSTVTGNKSGGNGGGVCASTSSWTHIVFNVYGKVVVKDNTNSKTNSPSNLYLASDTSLYGDVDNNSRIGISTLFSEDRVINDHVTSFKTSTYFMDSDNWHVEYDSKENELYQRSGQYGNGRPHYTITVERPVAGQELPYTAEICRDGTDKNVLVRVKWVDVNGNNPTTATEGSKYRLYFLVSTREDESFDFPEDLSANDFEVRYSDTPDAGPFSVQDAHIDDDCRLNVTTDWIDTILSTPEAGDGDNVQPAGEQTDTTSGTDGGSESESNTKVTVPKTGDATSNPAPLAAVGLGLAVAVGFALHRREH